MTRPEIRIGMRVSDNDPWYFGGRVMVVYEVGKEYAVLRPEWRSPSRKNTRILLRRIHTDGKPRKSGWSVVT